MTSRRKSAGRSLSLRTSNFIKLMKPFRPTTQLIPESEGELQGAVSDPNINITYQQGVHQKIIDKEGRIITNSPDLTYIPKYKSNGVPRYDPPVRNRSVLDTAWLGQPRPPSTGSVRRRGLMMGRCAVSYQNLSPAGDIFAKEPGQKLARVGEHKEESSLTCSSFSSDGSRPTTNVGWLVGTSKPVDKAQPDHHIDILELQPPSHLEVAPLTNIKEMGYSLSRSKTVRKLVKTNTKTVLPSIGSGEIPTSE